MGKHVFKCPLDLWVYQEIIFEIKPDLIIESGTYHGGSAFFFAHILDIIGKGEVVTIDVDRMPDMPVHDRIKYLEGSSISDEVVAKISESAEGKKNVMVFLDSDHKKEHVIQELNMYHKFVTPGSYLIVEDSNLNGHPIYTGFGVGPGPMEAIEEFLPSHPEFEIDKSREKFLLTFNPNGFLKKSP
jgi:cephalosporin hydroxylase